MTFEIYRRLTWRGQRWFWRLRSANREIVCSGQATGYKRRVDVIHVIKRIVEIEVAQIKEIG